MRHHRSGQAIVEVLVLTPAVVACVAAFAIVVARVAATARLESAAQIALAADAAGEPVRSALNGRVKVVVIEPQRIVITVAAPLRDLTLTVPRIVH
jgi:hypothetical protein